MTKVFQARHKLSAKDSLSEYSIQFEVGLMT